MNRTKALSALALAGLLTWLAAAVAQAPPKKEPPPKPADPVAEAIRNHPDVRVAEAKLRVAEAELAQAKLAVIQRVKIAQAKVNEANVRHGAAARQFEFIQQVTRGGKVAQAELLAAERDLAAAKLALTAAEAELKAATAADLVPTDATTSATARALQFLAAHQQEPPANDYLTALALFNAIGKAAPPAGSAGDKLRELLDKPVSVDIAAGPFGDVMAAFVKQTGLAEVTFRYPTWANAEVLRNPPKVGPLKGEQTVAGWLQLILDDFNPALAGTAPPDHQGKYEVYVREYGLLMTKVDLAPPGAMTLGDFVRQLRAEKAAKAEPKK